jgi:hypothetical protein
MSVEAIHVVGEGNQPKGDKKQTPLLNAQEAQLHAGAEAGIAALLGVPEDQVHVSVRERTSGDDPQYRLTIAFDTPGFSLDMQGLRNLVRDKLSQAEFLHKYTTFHEPKEEVVAIKNQIIAATQNTDFDQNLLNWPGFDPEVAKDGIDRHAVKAFFGNSGRNEFYLEFHATAPETVNSMGKKLDTQLEARLPAIKEAIKTRGLRYIEAEMQRQKEPTETIQQAIEEASTKFDNLIVQVGHDKGWGGSSGSISIKFLSPEQKAIIDSGKGVDDALRTDEVKETNPLNLLDDEKSKQKPSSDLMKTVAAAVLHAGDGAQDMFPQVAGSLDIKKALAKSFAVIAKQHPEQKAALDAILENPYWGNEKDLPFNGSVYVKTLPVNLGKESGHYSTAVDVPANEIEQVLQQLAAFAPNQEQGAMVNQPDMNAVPNSVVQTPAANQDTYISPEGLTR